jgi:amidase
MTISQAYQDLITAARQRREAQLPDKYRIPKDKYPGSSETNVVTFAQKCGLFTPRELEITDANARDLVSKIGSGSYSCVEVTEAFIKRASYAHQLTNCMTEMFFDRALERASYLDSVLGETGKPVGPLHGLPISIKDQHQIKGTTVTIGFTSWSTEVSAEDSAMITLLYSLGAVLYCKTTVPVAMMMPDTDTHLFGPTLNPNNLNHSAGGSSGGEGALLAFGGSPVGFGSDIGGSIRIPSHYNGLYGLKPTSSRFPIAGNKSGLRGQHTIKSVVGPMSRSLESVEFITKTVFNANPEAFDPHCVPVPWREPQLPDKLVFGVVRTDNNVEPTPAVKRALEVTIESLKRRGHEVVEWEPYQHARLETLVEMAFVADGGRFVHKSRGEEPLFPYMAPYGEVKEAGVSTLWEINYERATIEEEYFRRWNNSHQITESGRPVDGLIVPASPVSSHPSHHFCYVGYTSVFNALDYPSVLYPVLWSDAAIDGKPDHAPLSEKDRKVWDSYDPEAYHSGRVGLQIVCRRHEDEKAIALAKVITKALDEDGIQA